MLFDSEITTKSRDQIVLERARARIAKGWCQGRLQRRPLFRPAQFCVVGAVEHAIYDCTKDGRNDPAVDRVVALLGLPPDTGKWNDAPSRTKAEVLARFDEAIARLSA